MVQKTAVPPGETTRDTAESETGPVSDSALDRVMFDANRIWSSAGVSFLAIVEVPSTVLKVQPLEHVDIDA